MQPRFHFAACQWPRTACPAPPRPHQPARQIVTGKCPSQTLAPDCLGALGGGEIGRRDQPSWSSIFGSAPMSAQQFRPSTSTNRVLLRSPISGGGRKFGPAAGRSRVATAMPTTSIIFGPKPPRAEKVGQGEKGHNAQAGRDGTLRTTSNLKKNKPVGRSPHCERGPRLVNVIVASLAAIFCGGGLSNFDHLIDLTSFANLTCV